MENPYGIDKEKLEWLEQIGAKAWDRPMVYRVSACGERGVERYCLSKEYIEETPLSDLKKNFEKTPVAKMIKEIEQATESGKSELKKRREVKGMEKIEKTIEAFFERDRAEKKEAIKREKKAVPVKVDCKVAKEVFYQTALMKSIQDDLMEIKLLLNNRR